MSRAQLAQTRMKQPIEGGNDAVKQMIPHPQGERGPRPQTTDQSDRDGRSSHNSNSAVGTLALSLPPSLPPSLSPSLPPYLSPSQTTHSFAHSRCLNFLGIALSVFRAAKEERMINRWPTLIPLSSTFRSDRHAVFSPIRHNFGIEQI